MNRGNFDSNEARESERYTRNEFTGERFFESNSLASIVAVYRE